MTDTQQRIVSAFILVLALTCCFMLGPEFFLGFILAFGAFSVDELHCNFLKKERFSRCYFCEQAIFLVPFIYINFFQGSFFFFDIFTSIAVILNITLLIYFFTINMDSTIFVRLLGRWPLLCPLLILLPMMALASLAHYIHWNYILSFLLVITYGMDSGAWFFGRKFGKHKLCPRVSPSKTIEGLVLGALGAAAVASVLWEYLLGNMTLYLFLIFCSLGAVGQLGDLVQSKIKRQFNIKDSSSLIPGHGGAYDRIDGLLFLTPFYSLMLRSYYLL